SAWPLFVTRAAARPDAPILRPTSRFGAFGFGAFGLFEAFGFRASERSCFQNGFDSVLGFFCLGSFGAFGLRPKESSFLSSDCFFSSFGSGGSSAAGTGG